MDEPTPLISLLSSIKKESPYSIVVINYVNTVIEDVSNSTIAVNSSDVTQLLTTNPDAANIFSQIEAIIRTDRTKSDAEKQEALQTVENIKAELRTMLNSLVDQFPAISECVETFLSL